MRGDRPLTAIPGRFRQPATPHARGSTFTGLPAGTDEEGYPACAGIDRSSRATSPTPPRLPRMRGDRPPGGNSPGMPKEATPHARGSTSSVLTEGEEAKGYPACAGIDPRKEAAIINGKRLPRMRGDRPSNMITPPAGPGATPHARGSTFPTAHLVPASAGYPACAGIDR